MFDDGSGDGPALYAGGSFITAGDTPALHIARWDGQDWHPVGSGVNGLVISLADFDDGSGGGSALYAGGEFTMADGVPARNIARWNGAAWEAVGEGVDGQVLAMVSSTTVREQPCTLEPTAWRAARRPAELRAGTANRGRPSAMASPTAWASAACRPWLPSPSSMTGTGVQFMLGGTSPGPVVWLVLVRRG